MLLVIGSVRVIDLNRGIGNQVEIPLHSPSDEVKYINPFLQHTKSRLNISKEWGLLASDLSTWQRETAPLYFPKGNVNLQVRKRNLERYVRQHNEEKSELKQIFLKFAIFLMEKCSTLEIVFISNNTIGLKMAINMQY